MLVLVSRAIGADGAALWEDYFPLSLLLKRRAEAGRIIFALQYQNDASLATGAIFREEDFEYFDRPPEGLRVYQGVDLAVKRDETADYFAVVTVGVREGAGGVDYYVLDAFRERTSFTGQAEAVKRLAKKFRPEAIGIETVAYQEALYGYLADNTDLPVRKVTRTTDKVMRAWRLSPLFENGRIFLGRSQKALADELAAFPDGEHDDLFDALETAVGLHRSGGRGWRLSYVPGV